MEREYNILGEALWSITIHLLPDVSSGNFSRSRGSTSYQLRELMETWPRNELMIRRRKKEEDENNMKWNEMKGKERKISKGRAKGLKNIGRVLLRKGGWKKRERERETNWECMRCHVCMIGHILALYSFFLSNRIPLTSTLSGFYPWFSSPPEFWIHPRKK